MRSLTYLVAVSLDGFIAAEDGSFDVFPQAGDHIDWLLHDLPETMPGHVRAALDITAPNATFDTVVMGWNTFAVGLPHGIDDPYPHLRQFVCSRTHDASEVGGAVELSDQDPVSLVRALKQEPSDKDIWLCGGGTLAGVLHAEIDRLVLKINPVVLGTGIPLFGADSLEPQVFLLRANHAYDSGVLVATYDRRP